MSGLIVGILIIYFIFNLVITLWLFESGVDEMFEEGFKVKHLLTVLFFPLPVLFIIALMLLVGLLILVVDLGKKISIHKFLNKKLF